MSLLAPEAHDWVGRSETYAPYPVTRTDIARYCHVLGLDDAVYLDPGAARAAGHPDVVAPPGYHMVIRHAMPNVRPLADLAPDGGSPDLTPPSSATRRMAGETTTDFLSDIHAGNEITLTKTLTAVTEKAGRSGPLGLVTYQLDYRTAAGELTVRETYVRILR
ncbi:MaoC family dehydratase N-terminal domain-containing protein [Pseudonocardia sp. C8]|uniref:FAS1-like dehydratase domain-containing protein n=1 Tax=Pseudonocardia sp. C8 TaxID=2762759 RepID=UPI0016430BD9|nr:MaoC family dehydratase N-terminal domain-containing protein [Pseudonocardia sp. C8]MBC3192974.1 MaoC family dehydratase N-terminal domain-containing protein [Pseudonocardia sp. C8]